MSRAHPGVRFWDERPECRRQVLEVLRQPLEESVLYIQSPAHPRSRRPSRERHTGGARTDRQGLTQQVAGTPRRGLRAQRAGSTLGVALDHGQLVP
jgi:Magnesium chelatase, subunit ChlI